MLEMARQLFWIGGKADIITYMLLLGVGVSGAKWLLQAIGRGPYVGLVEPAGLLVAVAMLAAKLLTTLLAVGKTMGL